MRILWMLCLLYSGAMLCAAPASVRWHQNLSDSGLGYWRARIAVDVKNTGSQSLAGQPVILPIGKGPGQAALAGFAAQSLRVCNAKGTEYLFQITPSRTGRKALADGDILRFAVDVPAGGTERYYIYADNPGALPVTDFLNATLVNGDFEQGDAAPDGWAPSGASDQYRRLYLRTGGRGNSRCVYHRVAQGAKPEWIKWGQTGIRVIAGRKYALRAWVKAKDVNGAVGWYFHVNGVRPQMINQVLDAGAGTYDWKEVTASFTVPEGGQTLDIGTVLYGSGEAWYDEVSLVEEDRAASTLSLNVGHLETFYPRSRLGSNQWQPLDNKAWPVRAEVRVVGSDARPGSQVAITADLRRALHMVRRLASPGQTGVRAQVVDAARMRAIPHTWIDNQLCFTTDLLPYSEQRFFIYLAPSSDGSRLMDSTGQQVGARHAVPLRHDKEERARQDYARLLHSPANLARQGDFEKAGRALQKWSASAEGAGNTPGVRAEVAQEGIIGKGCLKLDIPSSVPLAWIGWRQKGIPVKPETAYLYAGYVQTRQVRDGAVDMYGHYMTADGGTSPEVMSFGTGVSLSGDTPWTLCSSLVTTPSDCASVELHLTMLAHGTVWHDGVLFMEAVQGRVIGLQTPPAPVSGSPVALWSVNPMVKLFPDDPPGITSKSIAISAALNEWEPVQLGLWSLHALKGVSLTVSPLRSASGKRLPPVRIYRIGTVPVDRPSAYYSSRVPDWCRKVPLGSGVTDGWAGEWPDPLPPFKAFDLSARRTQGLWLDIYVPEDTAPGDYRGMITLKGTGIQPVSIPLTVKVWNFRLPERSHLQITYDLRGGPGWDVTRSDNPDSLKQWYRLLTSHYINADSVRPDPVFRYENGKVTMDAAAFDKLARFYFDDLKMNASYTPGLFYTLGWAYRPSPIFGLKPFTPEYEAAYKSAYKLFIDHLTERGWRKYYSLYLSDEPFFDREQVVSDLKYVIGLAKSVAPDVPIYSSTWRHAPGLDGYLSHWGVGQYGCFSVEDMKKRLAAGDKIWFTTDGQQALDTPYLGTERLLPTYCFKYGVSGYEFWGVSWWTYDPWKRGWHQFISQSDQGTEFYWIRYPNGDGYLTYPGEPVGLKEPVASIRMKAVREGAEDYEYYVLLRSLIEQAKSRHLDTRPAEKALASAVALVTIPNAGGMRSTRIMPDPDAIYRVRQKVAGEIVRLSGEVTSPP